MEAIEGQNMKNLLWQSLPTELLLNIFDYLHRTDWQQVRLVCRRWRDVIYFTNFFNEFKLVIRGQNVKSIYENLISDKDLAKRLAFGTLELHDMELSADLEVILKSLAPHVRSLRLLNTDIFSVLNDCLPELEELKTGRLYQKEKVNIYALDLNKFKNFKSLKIVDVPDFIVEYLLTSLTCQPRFKLEKLTLLINGERDRETLGIEVLRHHGDSLEHLDLVLSGYSDISLSTFSKWTDVFPLLRKLKVLKMSGVLYYNFLIQLIEGIPKEAPLRKCNFSGLMLLDDDLLKRIFSKWHLESVDVSHCASITEEGFQNISQMRPSLKVLNLASCKHVAANYILKTLTAETNTTLKNLSFSGDEPIELLPERLPELTTLYLENFHMSVDDNILQSIFQHQRKLRQLNLNECKLITDDGLIGFGPIHAPITNLKGLVTLGLRGCKKISDRALMAFKFNELRQLCFGYCDKITSVGIKELVKNCASLEKLSITSCSKIDDEAILYIVRDLKRLRYLNVSNCSLITGKALDYVAEHCKYLKLLHICGIDRLERPIFKKKMQELAGKNIVVDPTIDFPDSD